MRVYLDHNATTPLRAEARAAMVAAMDMVGNPSSVHAEGRKAKLLVEKARVQVATLAGCVPQEIVFTSGATEAASTVLGPARAAMYAETAHDCILKAVPDHPESFSMGVMPEGRVATGPGYMVTFDHQSENVFCWSSANSETGILETDDMLPRQVEHAVILEDSVQIYGKLAHSPDVFGATYQLMSAHKLGGPKGVGALYVRGGIDVHAMIKGGGQEMGRRSGTENVIGIAGFGAAAEAAARDVAAGRWEEVKENRDLMESALEDASNATIFVGKDAPRLPNTSCILTPGWKGETQVMQMDLAGFAVSAGSACSSGKVKASTVLRAMGFNDTEAASAIRVSLGLNTTKEEVMQFAEAWAAKLKKHQARAA